MWHRVADGSEGATFTWTSTAARTWAGGVLRIGSLAGHPDVDVSGSETQTAGTMPACPDLTASQGDLLVLRVSATDFTNYSTPGTSNVVVWRVGDAGETAVNVVTAAGQASAGATGAAVFNFGTTSQGCVAMVVVMP